MATKKRKKKLVIFNEPKIKKCWDRTMPNFVDFYKIRNLGYGLQHSILKNIRTIQDVMANVLSIDYVYGKPNPSYEGVACRLKSVLLFDKFFLQDVKRIKNLIKRNRKKLLKHYKMPV